MERSKRRRSRPSLEGLEGRMLLSVASSIHQPRGVDKYSPLGQTSTNTSFDYTTAQGAKVAINLIGPGTLAGTGLDSSGNLNLVFSGTTVFSSIIGTAKGGPGTANLASITTEALPLGSLSGLGGDLIGRVLLPSFNLVPGGQVNLTAGVQSFSLNAVASDSQVHLRDAPLNTSLGLQSYENTITGTGVTYAKLSSNSSGATSSSSANLTNGTAIGVATGSSAGGVTTLGTGTLNPTAVGFGGGEVGAINGAIPLINTVGNGQNYLGTPGLTQTQVNQGRTTSYVVGTDGGDQLSTVAGTFTPGVNLIEPNDISLPGNHPRVPPPGVIIAIKHVNGGPTQDSPPLGDPLIYGYDARANALIKFDATTGAALQTIPLPASTTGVGGVSLARNGAELVVLVGVGADVLAYDATSGAPIGRFALPNVPGTGFTAVTGIATGNLVTVLADANDGPSGTIQEIDVARSIASGVAQPIGQPFFPSREFSLAGTLAGVPGTGNLFAIGAGFFDTAQPNARQAGILTVNAGSAGLTESARTVLTDAATMLDQASGPNNGIAGSNSIAVGSLDSFLAIDYGTANGVNSIRLYSPNGLTNEGSFTLADANPLADLTQSFHPELNSTALIDVQGNVQSFTGKTATGLVLNVAGNFDQLTINNASDSSVIGLPFAHVNIAVRNNVSILTNSRLVGTRGNVTVNAAAKQVGPLFLA